MNHPGDIDKIHVKAAVLNRQRNEQVVLCMIKYDNDILNAIRHNNIILRVLVSQTPYCDCQ